MKVKVKLYAGLERCLPAGSEGREAEIEIDDGSTVGRLLEELAVPLDQAKLLLVNARHAELDQPLKDGDLLVVFPPVGGG